MTMNKEKALETTLSYIERQYGRGAVMRLGSAQADSGAISISTGAISLDVALGIGGLPRGRITEIFGQESSGKTTIALHLVAEAQREGGTAAFIDAEHALDPKYCRSLGIDLENLLVSQPDTGEQALEIADALVRSGALDIFVVDSVAALVPRAELEGEMGDAHVGLQARLMSQALRKLAGTVSRSQTAAVFINQLREKIGVMFGNPETTPGGRALKFWSSVRLDVRRAESVKTGDEITGSRIRVRVVKNKLAPPFREAELEIVFGKGVSRSASLLDFATQLGIVERAGTWYSFGEEKMGQGREMAKHFLEENEKVSKAIEAKIWDKVKITPHRLKPAEVAEGSAATPKAIIGQVRRKS
jgi:recombination protein RecA